MRIKKISIYPTSLPAIPASPVNAPTQYIARPHLILTPTIYPQGHHRGSNRCVNHHTKITREPGKSSLKNCHPGIVQSSGFLPELPWVLSMEFIAEIRRRHFVSGESISSIARSLKLSRPTIRKALKNEKRRLKNNNLIPHNLEKFRW